MRYAFPLPRRGISVVVSRCRLTTLSLHLACTVELKKKKVCGRDDHGGQARRNGRGVEMGVQDGEADGIKNIYICNLFI